MNCGVIRTDSSTIDRQYDYLSTSYCNLTFENIRKLQQRRKFCDVIVKVQGEKYFCHRVVLVAASQYFANVLDGEDQLEEKQEVEIDFNDITPPVFELILEYIYSGNIIITSAIIGDLFLASKTLEMRGLEAACSEALPVILTPRNWYQVKPIAGQQRSETLYNGCHTYAIQHFMEIKELKAFLKLPFNEVKDLVVDPELVVSSEEDLYSAVLTWVKHDLPNRKVNLFDLIKAVKLPLIDKDFFMKIVTVESLFRDDVECMALLLETSTIHAGMQPKSPARTVPRVYGTKRLIPYIFVTGGIRCDSTLKPAISDCEVYNPRTNIWQPIKSMASVKRSHAAVGYDLLLYTFGGMDNQTTVSSVECYNPFYDSWTSTTKLPQERRVHDVCSVNDSIFICGGRNAKNEYLNTVEQYDPLTALYATAPTMNTKRGELSIAVTGGCIYVIGGRNLQTLLNSVERYDPREGRWFPAPSMSIKRVSLGATVLNENIYCTGGHSGTVGVKSGEHFNIRRNAWEPIPVMLNGKYGHKLLTLDGCIYSLGGLATPKVYATVEKFDPDNNRWVEMPSMTNSRYWFGATVLDCFEINHSLDCNLF